jgi:TonB family protein
MKTAVANPAVKTAAPAAEAPVAQKKVVASKAHKGVWKPEYPGGIKALSDYIDNNLIWPAPDVAGDTQGTVIIRLFFDETGRITMANIVKSLAPAFDAAAFHLTLDMPNWLPGKEDGKPVASSIDLPVVFEHK